MRKAVAQPRRFCRYSQFASTTCTERRSGTNADTCLRRCHLAVYNTYALILPAACTATEQLQSTMAYRSRGPGRRYSRYARVHYTAKRSGRGLSYRDQSSLVACDVRYRGYAEVLPRTGTYRGVTSECEPMESSSRGTCP